MSSNKKLLLISFYFEPHRTVGAFRASYWAKNLNQYGYDVHVITSTSTKGKGSFPTISKIHTIKYNQKIPSIDQGFEWGMAISKYLKCNALPIFDIVIMTGGPFLQFFLMPKLRKMWPEANIVLDYRDPNSNNPRSYKQSIIKNRIQRICDNFFLKNSDIVITTNKYFAGLIDPGRKFIHKISLIENGYDEQCVADVLTNNRIVIKKPEESIILVYPGPFLFDRNPENLFNSINELHSIFHLHHIGATHKELLLPSSNKFYSHGEKGYRETLEIINNCDVGIILAGQDEIGATTKLFDYIGLMKPILIITCGKLNYGALEDVSKYCHNIFWCMNTVDDITRSLQRIKKNFNVINHPIEKSIILDNNRRSGLEKLINILENN